MTSEEIDYIITHFSNLISEPELIALNHHLHADSIKENDSRKRWYLERKMITEDPEVLKLLDNGYEQLRSRAAENVLKNHQGKVVLFNRCKICGKPARTPFARQCRFCGHDWH